MSHFEDGVFQVIVVAVWLKKLFLARNVCRPSGRSHLALRMCKSAEYEVFSLHV